MTRITKAQLNAASIHNPYGLAELQDEPKVFIVYDPQQLGRASRSASWQVCQIGYKTDPRAHWQDRGNKTFTCFHPLEDKKTKEQEALAWATEQYRIQEWERSPFGSYHPVGTLARAAKKEPV